MKMAPSYKKWANHHIKNIPITPEHHLLLREVLTKQIVGSPLQVKNRLKQKRKNLLSELWFVGFVVLIEERWWEITKRGAVILEKLDDAKQ